MALGRCETSTISVFDTMERALLQFQPLQSVVEAPFWSALGDLKLHKLQLQEGPLPITAHYSVNNRPEFPGFLNVEASSLEAGTTGSTSKPGQVAVLGDLYCLNTVEQLTKFDRKAAVQKEANEVWGSITSGEAEKDPSLLQRLVLLTYCDLKHYKYYYWFGFPALQPPSAFSAAPAASLATHFSTAAEQVLEACQEYAAAHPGHPCWLLKHPRDAVGALGSSGACGGSLAALPLQAWHAAQAEAGGELCLVAADCGNLAGNPGWPLRNALLMAAARWKVPSLTVVCLRERRGQYDAQASIVLQVALPEVPEGFRPETVGGWEVNTRGKQGPRMADLGPSMDPQRLAASAVDLNLRLMRWRAAPALEVERVSATKCLLLGAGTLGCSVARTLLGWGVRHITFVDNSRVAYSNPVRQSLYAFEDCLSGGKPKAQAAAEAVRRIFPGVAAQGVALSIPMPGHPIAEGEMDKVQQDISTLESLVSQHNVIFLLTDTRESRWLPTLLAAAGGKLAINSALGFDGFMVMRHGAPPHMDFESAGSTQQTQQQRGVAGEGSEAQREAGVAEGESSGSSVSGAAREAQAPADAIPRLGCYFCNDVVAPINSTVDRTLDQQCTVARPGLSSIAGSLAVELMAAVVAHPRGVAAPAAGTPASRRLAEGGAELPLGEVPHMVRGQLGGFSQMCLSGEAFRQCTACSEAVVLQYKEHGHAFLLKGLRDPTYLEDLTGLTELHQASERAVEGWDADGDDGEGEAARGNKGPAEEDAWEEL